MSDPVTFPRLLRFRVVEVDLKTGEFGKQGLKLKLHVNWMPEVCNWKSGGQAPGLTV